MAARRRGLPYRLQWPKGLDGEIGRHSGLKIRRLLQRRRTGSSPVRGTTDTGPRGPAVRGIGGQSMANYDNAPFEIHGHGDVPLRADVTYAQLQDALKPLWKYAGAKSLADGAESAYEEEPGITFDAQEHLLAMCWAVAGDETFRQSLDEMCMSLNE